MTNLANIPGVDLDVEALMRLRLIGKHNRVKRAGVAPQATNLINRKRGRGAEPYDVRPWSEGDDIRQIDRNVTARTGMPHVRNFHEEHNHNTLYLIDLRPSMHFGTQRAFRAVAAIEAVVISAWRNLDLNCSVGIAVAASTETRFLGWVENRRTFNALLHKLIAVYQELQNSFDSLAPPLTEALEKTEIIKGTTSLIIATGLDNPGVFFDIILERIAKRRDVTFLMISDPFERKPPPGSYPYHTIDGLKGNILIKNKRLREHKEIWPTRLQRIGARIVQINTELTPPQMAAIVERISDGSR